MTNIEQPCIRQVHTSFECSLWVFVFLLMLFMLTLRRLQMLSAIFLSLCIFPSFCPAKMSSTTEILQREKRVCGIFHWISCKGLPLIFNAFDVNLDLLLIIHTQFRVEIIHEKLCSFRNWNLFRKFPNKKVLIQISSYIFTHKMCCSTHISFFDMSLWALNAKTIEFSMRNSDYERSHWLKFSTTTIRQISC